MEVKGSTLNILALAVSYVTSPCRTKGQVYAICSKRNKKYVKFVGDDNKFHTIDNREFSEQMKVITKNPLRVRDAELIKEKYYEILSKV